MKPKSLLATSFLLTGLSILVACNNEQKPAAENTSTPAQETATEQAEVHGTEIKPGEIELTTPVNKEWVTYGKSIYDKLTRERLVGPGWKDVTKRREPHWIMNMITNVDMMLEKDPEAQKLLEQCLVRMPNQNLTKDESRRVLEFMRSNDGVK